jgi:hypothetical protein
MQTDFAIGVGTFGLVKGAGATGRALKSAFSPAAAEEAGAAAKLVIGRGRDLAKPAVVGPGEANSNGHPRCLTSKPSGKSTRANCDRGCDRVCPSEMRRLGIRAVRSSTLNAIF